MKDVHPIWAFCIFIVLIVINSIMIGMKSAIDNVSDSEFEELDDKKKKKISDLLDRKVEFNNTFYVITVLVEFLVGAFLFSSLSNFIVNKGIVANVYLSMFVGACVLYALFLIFGIFVPARLALAKSQEYIVRFYSLTRLFMIMFYPITAIIMFLAGIVELICGVDPKENLEAVSEEDIIDMVNEGHEQGLLKESEAKMINNIFEFDNKIVKDVMTHRKNIIAIEASTTLEKAVDVFIEAGLSRIPIYEEDLDSVIGILHFKDAFKEYGDVAKRKLTILAFKDILYDAHFIPETRSINVLFKEMQLQKIHMSIVVDEYGQTDGLVTMEDIIEEIVGNILDEHDQVLVNIKKQSENIYVVDGLTPLSEIEELLGIEFDEKEFETLNGLLISKYGKIPSDRDRFEILYKDYIFKVLKIQNKMISKVRILKNDK